ncbi:hypothetical protein V8E54_006492 [Elaphomyces granulatus]|jgi:hypothetical protein
MAQLVSDTEPFTDTPFTPRTPSPPETAMPLTLFLVATLLVRPPSPLPPWLTRIGVSRPCVCRRNLTPSSDSASARETTPGTGRTLVSAVGVFTVCNAGRKLAGQRRYAGRAARCFEAATRFCGSGPSGLWACQVGHRSRHFTLAAVSHPTDSMLSKPRTLFLIILIGSNGANTGAEHHRLTRGEHKVPRFLTVAGEAGGLAARPCFTAVAAK